MSLPGSAPGRSKVKKASLPLPASVALTLVAYGVLSFLIFREKPAEPSAELARRLVAVLPHAIVVVNALALILLAAGWWLIRNGHVRLHRIVMPSALGLIFLFLLMYVTRMYLGGIKHFQGPEIIYYSVYLPVLTIHLALSILCIQPVLYVALIGMTRRIEDIPGTKHRYVGRIAVPMWILSLALGLVVYMLLSGY